MPKTKFKKDPDSLLSTAYQKFEALFDEFDTVPITDWTVTHSLIYICKKYEKKFDMKFIISYKGSPSSSPEYKMTARIWMMLGAKKGDGEFVKEYIDWFYRNYNGKTRFTSIGALTRENNISNFLKIKKPTKIERSTPISKRMQIIVQTFPETAYIKTWGDLAFLKQSMEDKSESYPKAYEDMFEALESDGINLKMLENII